jgi:hypothetical protein
MQGNASSGTLPRSALRVILATPNTAKPEPILPVKTLLIAAALSGLSLCLNACAPLQDVQSNFQDQSARLEESQLTRAGFKLVLADTMNLQKILSTLPAYTINRVPLQDADYYIYPDPDSCACLYVGRTAEYQKLQELQVELQLSDQQLMVNDMTAAAQSGYDWQSMGPWGVINSNNLGKPNWDPH